MCALLLAPLSLPHHPICLAAEGEGAQLPAVRLPPSPLPSRRRSSSLAGPAVLPSLSLSLHPRAPSPAPALQRRDPGPPRPRRHRARPDPRRRGPPPAPDPAPWRRSSVRAGGRARVARRLPLPLPSGGGASPVELVAARLELELRPGGGISGRPRSLPIPALPPDPSRVDGASGGARVEQAAERGRLRAGRAGGSRRAQQARMAARARRRARRASTPVPRCLPPPSLFSGRLELGRLKVGAADLAGQRGRSERPPVD